MKRIILMAEVLPDMLHSIVALLFVFGNCMTYITSVLQRYGKKQLVEQQGIPYHGISSGKLRRYFSLQNFTDPFRVLERLQ